MSSYPGLKVCRKLVRFNLLLVCGILWSYGCPFSFPHCIKFLEDACISLKGDLSRTTTQLSVFSQGHVEKTVTVDKSPDFKIVLLD